MKMKTLQDKIWDAITDSAKKRFDYSSFEKNVPSADMADMIVFKIIIGYAGKMSKDKIARGLLNDMLIVGYRTEIKELDQFVQDKELLFQREIFASQMAREMLDHGSDPMIVYNSILQLL
jgi:hypothetical protein